MFYTENCMKSKERKVWLKDIISIHVKAMNMFKNVKEHRDIVSKVLPEEV